MAQPVFVLVVHGWLPWYIFVKFLRDQGLGIPIMLSRCTSLRFFPSTSLRTGSPVGLQNDALLP